MVLSQKIGVGFDQNVTGASSKGEKRKEEEVKKEGYYCSERVFGSFLRSIEVPREILLEKVSAHFKDGVLEVRLPKTEESKRKEAKIEIQ